MNLNEYLNKCLKTVKYFFETFIFKYVGIVFFSLLLLQFIVAELFSHKNNTIHIVCQEMFVIRYNIIKFM